MMVHGLGIFQFLLVRIAQKEANRKDIKDMVKEIGKSRTLYA